MPSAKHNTRQELPGELPQGDSGVTEILKSVSARVHVAVDRIAEGKPQEALAALNQLRRVLPAPSERHLLAAKDAADRGRA